MANIEDFQKTLSRFTELLKINKLKLDDEVSNHAVIFCEVGDKCAECVSIVDSKKDELKRLKAKLYLHYRADAASKAVKVTENVLDALIMEDAEYVEKSVEYLKWKEICDKMGALQDAFKQRGFMLKELVHLRLNGADLG